MASTIFELPDELLASLVESFPCRDAQIRALATLLYPRAAPCRNLVVHGTEATGKSAITTALLQALGDGSDLSYAIVKSAECVTARHLYERTVGLVADALRWHGAVGRCETLAALTVELTKMLKYTEREEDGNNNAASDDTKKWTRFVLVFDGIDRQRDAPPTLLPALARLAEIIPHLTTVFVLTAPSPSLLRLSSPPHLHFPPYTKAQYIRVLSRGPELPAALPNTAPQETADLWARFVAAVHDSLARPASRTLPRLRAACAALWARFTAPVAAGTHRAREFSKLLVAARAYFQDEGVLGPGILSVSRPKTTATTGTAVQQQQQGVSTATTTSATAPVVKAAGSGGTATATATATTKIPSTDLSTLLPPTARLLLVAAYLASHNAPRHDVTLFSTWHHGRRRRGGGVRHRHSRPKHRKIARKLLGPGVFVLERMVAIYAALRHEWGDEDGGDGKGKGTRARIDGAGVGVDGDVGMAVATLASLRLLVRVGGAGASGVGGLAGGGGGGGGGGGLGGADMDRGGKWRVNVGWEVVRGVGRSMGVEVEEWLIE